MKKRFLFYQPLRIYIWQGLVIILWWDYLKYLWFLSLMSCTAIDRNTDLDCKYFFYHSSYFCIFTLCKNDYLFFYRFFWGFVWGRRVSLFFSLMIQFHSCFFSNDKKISFLFYFKFLFFFPLFLIFVYYWIQHILTGLCYNASCAFSVFVCVIFFSIFCISLFSCHLHLATNLCKCI